MNTKEITCNIIIPIVAALLSGSLTLMGVLISIKHENKKRKEEKKESIKPLLYLINPMQDYNYKITPTYYFENDNLESNGYIEIILKNTDNAILILDSVQIEENIYYPSNGNVVDKNTIFYSHIYAYKGTKKDKKTNMIMVVKDSMGNAYKYKFGYRNNESEHIDIFEEVKK